MAPTGDVAGARERDDGGLASLFVRPAMFRRRPQPPHLPRYVSPLRRARHATAAVALPLLIAAGAALLLPLGSEAATDAAPRQMRLVLQIELQRDAEVPVAGGSARMQLRQRLDHAVTLVGDGVPAVANPLDPEDLARQAAQDQARAQQVQDALARQRANARPSTAPAAPDLAALQAQAQQLMARCGQDQACLMREAAALQARQMAAAGMGQGQAAALQTYASDWRQCEQRHAPGAARRACQDEARRRAGGTPEAGDHDAAPATPYLLWRSTAGPAGNDPAACALQLQVQLDETVSGQQADVQGPVPFRHQRRADDRAPAQIACGLHQAVLDTRSGRLWLDGGLPWPAAHVQVTQQRGGRTQYSGQQVQALDWHEAGDWLRQRLRNLSAQGSDAVTLATAGGGQTRVQLRWSLQPQ